MDAVDDYKLRRPTRSVLFPLEPIGVGSAMCESPESYIVRLAKSHSVARRTMEKFINAYGEELYDDVSGPPRLNAPTTVAQRFIERMADLTGVPSVRNLGLWRLHARLPSIHTLEPMRAWCADCLRGFRAAGVCPYLPLTWSLAEYSHCHIHGTKLVRRCFACGEGPKKSKVWSNSFDCCPRCSADLAASTNAGSKPCRKTGDSLSQSKEIAVPAYVAQFVEQMSKLLAEPDSEVMTQIIQRAISEKRWKNCAAFCKEAALPASTLTTLGRRQTRVSLGTLVRIAHAMRVSVASLLYKNLPPAQSAPPETAVRQIGQLRKHRKHDWSQTVEYAMAQIEISKDTSLIQLASELGVDYTLLLAHLKKHGIQPKTVYRAALVSRREKGVAELTKKLVDAREALRVRGTKVTVTALSVAVGRHRGTAYMRAALANIGLPRPKPT